MIYARIDNEKVAELFTPPAGVPISDCFHADLVWVDVSAVSPQPQPGWTYASGVFAPPAPPAPATIAERAATLMASGLTITSTSTPALDGTYACDATTQNHIQAEIVAIIVNGAFADGATTVAWPDSMGALHTFPSIAAFKSFATAIAAFVAACAKAANGTLATLPAASVTVP